MAKERNLHSEYTENLPEWYWERGLHDACVVCIEAYEFPFDYNKYTSQKNKYDQNMLLFKINAKGALFDSDVKEIRFFNYKILSENVELFNRSKIWWLSDKLTEVNDRYELEILLEDVDSWPEEFQLKLRFERAEVDRK